MASGKGTGGKMIVWGLLGLLIVSLFGFGTTNFGGSARSVASVGKAEVSVDDYARALQTEIRTMENQFNQAISVTQAEQFGVPARVISQLVDRTALDAETEARGLSVGDGTVRRELLGIEAFQGLDGNFDAEVYRNALSRLHLNERDFEAGLRKALFIHAVSRLVNGGEQGVERIIDVETCGHACICPVAATEGV